MRPAPAPRDTPWSTQIFDPDIGPVRLTGWLRDRPGADACVVVIHGLGGNVESRYVVELAWAADASGLSYLRLNLRGADRSGEDLYHAGLTADLRAALASPELARFRRLYVVGFSMGGHIALRWAAEPNREPRVQAVAAICAPLDLEASVRSIQRPFGRPYQWHVLRGLKAMYRAAAARRPMPIPFEEGMAIRTLIEWDDRIIAPRFKFPNRFVYYDQYSAGPVLNQLEIPTLFVAAEADPMVTADALRPWLADASKMVEVVWTARGGHVGFPADLDLGFGDVGPFEPQLIRWLLRHR